MRLSFIFILAISISPMAHAMKPTDCSDMEVWDFSMGMCMPLPMAGMPMKMLMVNANSFFVQTSAEGRRGANGFAAPNMFMVDAGSSLGDRHYINLDFMGTVEKWTFPKSGYPEFLQIGEANEDHVPFLDAQHPHSSPIMGLTLSDTISLGHEKDHAKIWLAPRGQSTDGPIAFMHRPTGMVNPDAPLGHHIGQDAGHISSTVIGASVRISGTTLEASTFHGQEPEPIKVDLPLGTPNSYALRLTQEFTEHLYAMASMAYVKSPESSDPTLDHIWRYSASIYSDTPITEGWTLHNTLIWGLINSYDEASALNSFAEEFWFQKNAHGIWGRVEELQRTPNELEIPTTIDGDKGKWVTAITLGYTRKIGSWNGANLGLGAGFTKTFLPTTFQAEYGGNPVTGRIFLQLGGMGMWDL